MKTTNVIFLTIVLFSSLLSRPVQAMQIRISPHVTFISETRKPANFETIRHLLLATDRAVAVSSNLFERGETYPCYIALGKGKEIQVTDSKERIMIDLPENFTQMPGRANQLRLINIMLLARLGIYPGKKYKKVPLWLTAGIWHRCVRYSRKSQLTGPLVYPCMNYLAVNDMTPSSWNIIKLPVYPQDGPAFAFYSEACELLINGLATLKSKNAFLELLRLSFINPKEKEANFRTAFNTLFEKWYKQYHVQNRQVKETKRTDPFEKWFQHVFVKKSVNMFMPGNTVFARRELKKIFEKIKYKERLESKELEKPRREDTEEQKPEEDKRADISPEEELITKETPLKDLLEKWDSVANEEEVAKILKNKLYLLKYRLPQPFYASIDKHIEAVGELEEGNPENFLEDYEEAQKEFRDACSYWEKVETFLLEVEQRATPASYRYNYAVKYLREQQKKQDKHKSELDRYLDKLESDFSK